MSAARIVLSGLGPKLAGLRWESDQILRIGRQGTADVVLRDFSVERLHAEVKYGGSRWTVRDLAESDNYPTLVNGVVLNGAQKEIHDQDVLQFGKASLKVAALTVAPSSESAPAARQLPAATALLPCDRDPAAVPDGLRTVERSVAGNGHGSLSHADLQIQAATRHTWDQALELIASDRK